MTIIARTALDCDAWDTPLFVLGPAEARRKAKEREDVAAVLLSRDRRKAGFTAEARGLCLLRVYYEEGELSRAVEALLGGRPEPDAEARDHERSLKLLL